jgi:hypothetical protein
MSYVNAVSDQARKLVDQAVALGAELGVSPPVVEGSIRRARAST